MARWEPPQEQVIEKPKPKRWPAVVLLLAIIAVSAYGLWMLYRRLHPPARAVATATDVRSTVTGAGDSLEVAVSWRLQDAAVAGIPDSMRVEVGRGGGEQSEAHVIPGNLRSDTVRIAAPAPGETISGYSCVAGVRGGRLARERCTPWQYVRPSAELSTEPTAPDTARASSKQAGRGPAVAQIVIQPAGQQVDPDIGGKCAAWQRDNPGRSVWIEVNRKAVPACMGPNGKPTVVQFCAFALLSDGRRVQTSNSTHVPYCEALFQEWVRARVT